MEILKVPDNYLSPGFSPGGRLKMHHVYAYVGLITQKVLQLEVFLQICFSATLFLAIR